MKNRILFLLIVLCASYSSAQSEVALQLELLTPDLIGEVVLEQEAFIEWVKLINEDIKEECAKEPGNKDLLVILTVHSDKDATFEVVTRPKFKSSAVKDLNKKIAAHPSPRTKFNEYSLMIQTQINEGSQSKAEFTPALVLPYDKKIAAFNELSLVEKKNDIQQWMKIDILPLLAQLEVTVDSAYAGVLAVGNLVDNKAYLEQSVVEITENNSDYWRATMEMGKGNQLIPFTNVCMLLANGEIDRAQRLLYIIRFFYDEKTLPAKLDAEISEKLSIFTAELSEKINEGIALHDQAKYDQAIKYYEKLLVDLPKSAWLNYELYFSQTAKTENLDVEGETWKNAKNTIYACDPMYPINARAKNGKEGYMLFRRQEINGLFSSKESLRTDFAAYADIALDLENYAFAGQLYWLILSHLKTEDYNDRDILAHFLYCLDKLGDTETIDNFKGDYTEKFNEITAERREIMKSSVIFQAFENEE